jgi:hypothetical protein
MKILFASTPASGHINPMFAIGQMLVAAGHEVVGLSANAMRDRIEAVGATFRAFPKDADFDLRNVLAVSLNCQPAQSRRGCGRKPARSASGPWSPRPKPHKRLFALYEGCLIT